MILGGQKVRGRVGGRPSAPVVEHDLGEIAPFHLAPVGVGRRPAGDRPVAQVAREVIGLSAARPLDADRRMTLPSKRSVLVSMTSGTPLIAPAGLLCGCGAGPAGVGSEGARGGAAGVAPRSADETEGGRAEGPSRR